MTLRKKLILSFILLVLILGSVIGYFSYQDAKELVLQSKEKEMADTINRIDISLNNWVDQVTTLAENIKENPMVTELMEEEAGNLTAEGVYTLSGCMDRQYGADARRLFGYFTGGCRGADSILLFRKNVRTGSRPIGRTGNRDAGGDRR